VALAAGKLRHRVVVEQLVININSFGEQDPAQWVPFAEVWAAIEPLSGREFLAASQTQSSVSCRITIRTLAGLLPSMRITHRDKVYNIAAILTDPVSGLEYMTLPCEVGLNSENAGPSADAVLTDYGYPILTE
jgi:SPP1 family predicted phage head-tail adaptor